METQNATDVLATIDHAAQRQLQSELALELELAVAKQEELYRLMQSAHQLGIAAETSPDGKPAYSNKDQRDAELVARVASDIQMEKLRKNIDDVRLIFAKKKIRAQFHADMIRILCTFAESAKQEA